MKKALANTRVSVKPASRNTARNGIYMWKPIRFFKQTKPTPPESA